MQNFFFSKKKLENKSSTSPAWYELAFEFLSIGGMKIAAVKFEFFPFSMHL